MKKKTKRCTLSSQTCFSTIAGVIALAHQRNKKRPCCHFASELHKNIVPCENQRSDSTFASTNEETGSGVKTFALIFEALLQSSFTLLFFLTTESPTVVKRRVCYTRVFGRYAKNLRRNLRNRQISRLCNGLVEQTLLPSRARTYVNVRSHSLRNPVM